MAKRKLCMTSEEAKPAKGQHKKPCGDCPWRRDSLAGWLGNRDADEWIAIAHQDSLVECHTLIGAQCAGLATYRSNVLKRPRDQSILLLPKDHELIFSGPIEFKNYHKKD